MPDRDWKLDGLSGQESADFLAALTELHPSTDLRDRDSMSETRIIVSPEDARRELARMERAHEVSLARLLAHTVATEPERIRAAVVKALRDRGDRYSEADAIENGADW